jgi:hypothetical protein
MDLFKGVEEVGLVVTCDSDESAEVLAAELGDVCQVGGRHVKVPLYSQETPNALAITAIARLVAGKMVGAIDGLAALMTPGA